MLFQRKVASRSGSVVSTRSRCRRSRYRTANCVPLSSRASRSTCRRAASPSRRRARRSPSMSPWPTPSASSSSPASGWRTRTTAARGRRRWRTAACAAASRSSLSSRSRRRRARTAERTPGRASRRSGASTRRSGRAAASCPPASPSCSPAGCASTARSAAAPARPPDGARQTYRPPTWRPRWPPTTIGTMSTIRTSTCSCENDDTITLPGIRQLSVITIGLHAGRAMQYACRPISNDRACCDIFLYNQRR